MLVADLNNMYLTHPTWAESDHESDKFEWIDCNDAEGQTLSFVKFGATVQDTLLVACNFSSQLCHRDWGCPHAGEWEVALDSNALQYGGKSLKLGLRFLTLEEPRNDQTFALRFSIERWSVLILKLKS